MPHTIKTTTGAPIVLDGDLLAVMEALYKEVTAKREFAVCVPAPVPR